MDSENVDWERVADLAGFDTAEEAREQFMKLSPEDL